jgi:hypothetical protein
MKTMRNQIQLCLLGLLLALPAVVEAQFTFTTNNGAITITVYTGTNSNVVIPDTTNGYPVTSIGGFYSSTSLTNVTIPNSVTNIASGVFVYQSSLTAITVDEQNSYYSSSNGILFDKHQTILIQAPGGIAGGYTIPASVTSIGDAAFEECGSLTNVTIGTNVTCIGNNTFNSCASLTDITIPNSVTNIGSDAFYYCGSVASVVIGPNVVNIGSGAFADCQSLIAITVDEQNTFYSSVNGLLFDKPQTTLIQAPGGIAGSYAIPASVTGIGDEAFSFCLNLTDITMPNSVTNIGSEAFSYCTSLTNVTMGTNVTSIGDYAFYVCSGLTRLTVPNGVISIGDGAFDSCGNLTNITMGTKVTSIGDYAFISCSGLTEFLIPDSVTSIGNSAFESCGSLTNIGIGTNVTTIGRDAFAFCSRLTGITIPSSVTNIVANSPGIVRIGIGAPLANGPIEMVASCGRLSAIAVDEQNRFYSSSNGILFNKSQTTLLEAPGGFVGSYVIPNHVTSIGAEAFQNCASLTRIAIPNSATNIGTAAFADCGSLTAMTVDGQNMIYSSINGILFDKPQTTLIQFPGGIGGSYAVSNGITSIGGTAFSGCSNLTGITIPNSVTNIGNSTFDGCLNAGIYFAGNAPSITSSGSFTIIRGFPFFGNNFYNPNAEAVYYLPETTGWGATFDGLPAYLWVPPYVCTPTSNSITINGYNGFEGSITIPDVINGLPVTTVASGAFDNSGSLGLTNIFIGANVTTIGNYAFAPCSSLTSITIPNSVTNIGSGAFAFCDNLKSVYFQGNAPSADSSVFFHWSLFPPIFFPPIYEPPTPTTVYYLPGTTGWGTTFGGCPTVLWNPQAQTSGASFGVRTNRFGFNITGTSNLVIVVEACMDLSNPVWQPVQTNTLMTGSAYFSDPQWTNYPGRFYRLRSP